MYLVHSLMLNFLLFRKQKDIEVTVSKDNDAG